MIINVDEKNIRQAAEIHSKSWIDSHINICAKDFLDIHNVKHQEEYLRKEMASGKKVYMLVEEKPVGIVSVIDNLIENLYILPEEQGKGYGTQLLKFIMNLCIDTPVLWILENNQKVYNLYYKYGFRKTGKSNKLSDTLSEIELKYVG